MPMSLLSEHKILTLALISAVVLAALWYGFSRGTPSSSLLTAQGTAGATNAEDQDLVETLLQLRAVSLSGTILNDPAFRSLQDFGTQIIPEPVGRPNPFAPIDRGAAATTTQRGSQLFPSGARP